MTDQNATAKPPAPVYAKLAVIGGGLIGSSVIRAARSTARRPRSPSPTPTPSIANG